MTTGFDRSPLVLIRDDGVTFEMWDDVTYTGSHFDSWTIPGGFTTDFATIPSAVAWAVPKMGAYTLAAIVHDLLCEGLNDWHTYRTNPISVAEKYEHDGVFVIHAPTANAVDTDAIFHKIASDLGTDPVTARLLWVGVRWGALANPARRKGWFLPSNVLPVLGWSLLFAPVLVPATLVVGVGQTLLRIARWLA